MVFQSISSSTYLSKINDLFDLAINKTSKNIVSLQVKNHIFKLVFAGDTLIEDISRAFTIKTDLINNRSIVIKIWDSKSTGVNFLFPEPNIEDLSSSGEYWKFHNHKLDFSFNPPNSAFYLFNHSRNEGMYWIENPSSFPQHERSAPLLPILNWWSSHCNLQILHAGVVGTAIGGVLIAGKSGSGKSTTCLSCFLSGMIYLGDDYTLVSTTDNPEAFNLYHSCKVIADENFSNVMNHFKDSSFTENGKSIIFLNEYKPSQIKQSINLKAILIPRIVNSSATTIEPTTQSKAYLALAPSTLFQLQGDHQLSISNIRKIVSRLPSFSLNLGNDQEEVSEKIKEFIKSFS